MASQLGLTWVQLMEYMSSKWDIRTDIAPCFRETCLELHLNLIYVKLPAIIVINRGNAVLINQMLENSISECSVLIWWQAIR